MSKITLLGESNLTPQELQDIGCVAVESSALEMLLIHSIKEILKLKNEETKLLVANTMLDKKLDLVHDLCKLRITDQKELDKLKIIVSELKEQIVNRNTIIHGFWRGEPVNKDEWPPVIKGGGIAKKIHRTKDKTISADKIRETAEKMYHLNQKLMLAISPIVFPDPSPQAAEPQPPSESRPGGHTK